MVARLSFLLAGGVVMGAAVGVMLWGQLGPGPLDVFVVAVRDRTGLPLAFAMWLTLGAMIVVAWLMGRRPGAGTVLAPLAIGPVAQIVWDQLGGVAHPGSMPIRVLIHLAAIGAAGVGAGALIVSGLGAGTGELLTAAASDRSGRAEPQVRVAFEASFVILGLTLGGPAGIGTVIAMAFIGSSVALGFRLVDAVAARYADRSEAIAEPISAMAN
jgi:uncharacterized membrane protein YczE